MKLVGISPFPFLSTSSIWVNLIYFTRELNSLRTEVYSGRTLELSLMKKYLLPFFFPSFSRGTKHQREPFIKIGDCPDVLIRFFFSSPLIYCNIDCLHLPMPRNASFILLLWFVYSLWSILGFLRLQIKYLFKYIICYYLAFLVALPDKSGILLSSVYLYFIILKVVLSLLHITMHWEFLLYLQIWLCCLKLF